VGLVHSIGIVMTKLFNDLLDFLLLSLENGVADDFL
jgi:hypothetical protein